MRTIVSLVCLCFLIWAGWMPETYAARAAEPVTVDLKNAEGQSVGTATLSQVPALASNWTSRVSLPVTIHCTSPGSKMRSAGFQVRGAAFRNAHGPWWRASG